MEKFELHQLKYRLDKALGLANGEVKETVEGSDHGNSQVTVDWRRPTKSCFCLDEPLPH
jgi:hypothetical protein